MPRHERMDRVVRAVGYAPRMEAERVLGELARRSPQLVSQHEWAETFLSRGTISAARTLIDLACEGTLLMDRGPGDTFSIARMLAAFIHAHPELRGEVVQRYQANAGAAFI
jgi:hypothetical protein